ncbi:MAG: hypothetical protein JWM71_648 [Solirubrobacteraceae bacterium]|nr:hypothetical protein [Solirubrobacteraceae bacterium]
MSEHPALRIPHAALRGTIAAMAMTGMRAVTVSLGVVDEAPPTAILRQRAKGLVRLVPRKRRRAVIELAHWSYGAAGGAAFSLLPDSVRQRPWTGPAYGLATWLSFELAIAPVLGLSQAKKVRALERVALATDHLLYGLVLSEMRATPRD